MSGVQIPSELVCPLCKGLIAEAILLPCCAIDACEECARAGISCRVLTMQFVFLVLKMGKTKPKYFYCLSTKVVSKLTQAIKIGFKIKSCKSKKANKCYIW